MSESYYHVTRSEQAEQIQQRGLQPTEAPECPDGVGIHLTGTLGAARKWAHRLRAEREEYETEYTILELTLPGTMDVVDDEYPGNGPSGAVVACTASPIAATHITAVEWL